MSEQILAALARYGLPALFIVVTIAAIGVPLPVTLLLIVTGSLAAQGVINIWWAIAVATVGASAGDQIGYAIGQWGGKALVNRLAGMVGKADGLKQLENRAARLGGDIFHVNTRTTPERNASAHPSAPASSSASRAHTPVRCAPVPLISTPLRPPPSLIPQLANAWRN